MSTEEEERKRDQSDRNQKNLHGLGPVTLGLVLRQNASPVFRRIRQDRATAQARSRDSPSVFCFGFVSQDTIPVGDSRQLKTQPST